MADQAAHKELFAAQLSKAGNGYLAAAIQPGVHGSFSRHTQAGFGVVEGSEQLIHFCIIATAFDADSALANGRQADVCTQAFADAISHAQSF